VEIIGDNIKENDETFYMEVFNPVGIQLVGNVQSLSVYHTLVNDDLI